MSLENVKCPGCGETHCLSIDSSREMSVSIITCDYCLFRFQRACDEETLEEKFIAKFGDMAGDA